MKTLKLEMTREGKVTITKARDGRVIEKRIVSSEAASVSINPRRSKR